MNAELPTITQIVASAANEGRKCALILHLGELTLAGLPQDEIRDRLLAYAVKLANFANAEPDQADDTERVQLTDKGKAAVEALAQDDQSERYVNIPDIFDPDPRMSRHTLFESAIIGAAMFVRHEGLIPEFNKGSGVSDHNFFWEKFDTLVHCIMCAEANLINRVIEDDSTANIMNGILRRDMDDLTEGLGS